MCGLCGVLSPNITHEQTSIFQALMAVSTIRGPWGSGIVAVPKKNAPIDVLRNPMITAAELAHSNDFYKLFGPKQKTELVCLMGHARYPTSGGYELSDCHPHEAGDILAMHNGTMTHVLDLKVEKKDNDSSLLIEAIATYGLEEALRRSKGAYALTMVNKAADTLTLIRNNDRPLYVATAFDVDTGLFWASEVGFLRLVLERSKKFRDSKQLKYYNINPERVLTFRLHNTGAPTLFSHTPLIDTPNTTDGKTTNEKTTDEKTIPADHLEHITRAPYSLRRDELIQVLHAGCANCCIPSTYQDYLAGNTHWHKRNEFFCDSCLTYDDLAQTYFISSGLQLPKGIAPVTPTPPITH